MRLTLTHHITIPLNEMQKCLVHLKDARIDD